MTDAPAILLEGDVSGVSYAGKTKRNVPVALVVVAMLAIALGIGFRFYHLDRKVYWGDEVYSSLRMFGDTEADLVARADQWHDARDLWAILHPTPAGGLTGPLGPARALAVEEPHHAPIYFEIAHFWVGAFGNSIAVTRSLSAFISLLAFPCAFWLALELYGSRRAGWIAAALFALSPVVVLYAQQAREYALWTVTLLALAAALLRAIRLDRTGTWTLFAFLVAFALYVHPLSTMPLGGLALYALAMLWRDRAKLLHCGLAFAAGGAAFVPWLVFLLRDLHTVTDSLATTFNSSSTPTEVVRAFFGALRLNFLDLDWVTSSRAAVAGTGAALLVIAIAIVGVIRQQPARICLFLACLLIATTLPLLLPDLISHGQRVKETRYLVPAFVTLQFVFVGWLDPMFEMAGSFRAAAGYAVLALLLAASTLSCAVSSQAVTWWSTQQDNSIYVAGQVNQAKAPMIVGDGYVGYPLVLANYLRPDVGVRLWPKCYECRNPSVATPRANELPAGNFATLYALGPSPALRQLVAAFVARNPAIDYRCINIRKNCVSDLNIEPIFGPFEPQRAPQ